MGFLRGCGGTWTGESRDQSLIESIALASYPCALSPAAVLHAFARMYLNSVTAFLWGRKLDPLNPEP